MSSMKLHAQAVLDACHEYEQAQMERRLKAQAAFVAERTRKNRWYEWLWLRRPMSLARATNAWMRSFERELQDYYDAAELARVRELRELARVAMHMLAVSRVITVDARDLALLSRYLFHDHDLRKVRQ